MIMPQFRCDGCNRVIDPDCCWCGAGKEDNPYDGHRFIPMGCFCYHPSKSTIEIHTGKVPANADEVSDEGQQQSD